MVLIRCCTFRFDEFETRYGVSKMFKNLKNFRITNLNRWILEKSEKFSGFLIFLYYLNNIVRKLTGDVKYDMLDIIALSIHCQICSFALIETFVLQFNVRNLQESLRRICRVFYIRPKTRERQEKLFHAFMTKLKVQNCTKYA